MFRYPVWKFVRRYTFCIGPLSVVQAKDNFIESFKKTLEFVPSEKVSDLSKLREGDHIKFSKLGVYAHHAIITKIDKEAETLTLIHFYGDSKISSKLQNKASIREDTWKLSEHQGVALVKYNESITQLKRLPRLATVAVAEYFKEHPNINHNYNLLMNNCEHLAFSCTLGYAISFQQMKPLIIAFLALQFVTSNALHFLMGYLMSKQVVRYTDGDDFVTLVLEDKEVKLHFKVYKTIYQDPSRK